MSSGVAQAPPSVCGSRALVVEEAIGEVAARRARGLSGTRRRRRVRSLFLTTLAIDYSSFQAVWMWNR